MGPLRVRYIEFQVAAFLIPLGVRLIPEMLASPYPIGFDTAAYYIPIVQARLALFGGLTNYVGTILPDLLFTYAYILTGNAIFAMKIIPAFLLGFLGWSTFLFGCKALKWNSAWSLGLAFILTLNIVTLRISWDLHRNIMGLALVMLTLALLMDEKPVIKFVVLPFITCVAILTHEFSAAIILVVVLVHLSGGRRYLVSKEWLPFLPAALILILQIVTGRGLGAQIQSIPATSNPLGSLTYNLGFILFAFGVIIPIALAGLRLGAERKLAVWTLLCLVFGLTPALGLNTGLAYRWILMLAVPLSVFFVQGIRVLNSLRPGINRRIGRLAIAVSLIALIVLSSGYLGIHGAVEDYFRLAPQYNVLMPVTMVESTIQLDDLQSFMTIANWANSTIPRTGSLILPFQLYGWYLTAVAKYGSTGLALDQTKNLDDILSQIEPGTGPRPIYGRGVDLYAPSDLSKLVDLAKTIGAGNKTDIYVVWWADSQGDTFGRLPNVFLRALTVGRLTVSRLNAPLPVPSTTYAIPHYEVAGIDLQESKLSIFVFLRFA